MIQLKTWGFNTTMATGIAYRGAIGGRLATGGPIVLWLGWECFTGNNLAEVTEKIDQFLGGK